MQPTHRWRANEMQLPRRLALAALTAGLMIAPLAAPALAQGGPPGPPPGMPPGGPPPGMGPGGPPPGMPPGGPPPGMPPPSENDMRAGRAMMQAVFGLLGVTPDQIGGRSLVDVAAARGVDVNTLVQSMAGAARSWLDGEVVAGRLSQDDADAIFQRSQQVAPQMLTMPPPPPGLPPGGPPPGGPPR